MNDSTPMLQVILRNNDTKELRLYEHEDFDAMDGREFNDYIWREGNYGCDCNRELFWERAIEMPEEQVQTLHVANCNDGGYTIMAIFRKGRQVYGETPPR